MKIIMEQFFPYDNVSIYFPQGNTETITNLNNYMDTIHFNSTVANQIIDEISDNHNKLTRSNYLKKLDEFYQFINSYNYNSLLETK